MVAMTPQPKPVEQIRLKGIAIVRSVDPFGDIRSDLRNKLMDDISEALTTAILAEREACAKVATEKIELWSKKYTKNKKDGAILIIIASCSEIVADIRARSEHGT